MMTPWYTRPRHATTALLSKIVGSNPTAGTKGFSSLNNSSRYRIPKLMHRTRISETFPESSFNKTNGGDHIVPAAAPRFFSDDRFSPLDDQCQFLPRANIDENLKRSWILFTTARPFLQFPLGFRNLSKFSHNRGAAVLNQYRPITSSSKCCTSGKPSARYNYHEACEAGINKQINMELYSSYIYLSMAYYFDRDDVASPGFHKYFKDFSDDEHSHAKMYMKYQNERGGRIVLSPVKKPSRDDWSSPLECVNYAIEIVQLHYKTLLELHKCASSHGDAHLCNFLEETGICEQVDHLKELSDLAAKLQRVGPGLGEHILAAELAGEKCKS